MPEGLRCYTSGHLPVEVGGVDRGAVDSVKQSRLSALSRGCRCRMGFLEDLSVLPDGFFGRPIGATTAILGTKTSMRQSGRTNAGKFFLVFSVCGTVGLIPFRKTLGGVLG
jgi:hypothetical protein